MGWQGYKSSIDVGMIFKKNVLRKMRYKIKSRKKY